MAQVALRRRENVPGDLFVDASCIDCDTCRWMAPAVFGRRGGQSAVVQQPSGPMERRQALHALLACPTASIGTLGKAPDLAAAQEDFPLPVCPGVSHLGYHDAATFGATSYLIRHPLGNVLVDTPRFAAPLVRRIEALGGAKWLLLTHRDDVGDHAKWARHFGLTRVLHENESPIPDGPVEMFLQGQGSTMILPGITAISVPGHTQGHVAYLLDPRAAGITPDPPGNSSDTGNVLFTGDHLAFDDDGSALEAWPEVCWYDWSQQTASMNRLALFEFSWVLPGHGRRGHLPAGKMREQLLRLVAWMRQQR